MSAAAVARGELFCSLVDASYLPRLLALHASLVAHGGAFSLLVLTLDTVSSKILNDMRLAGVEIVTLRQLEDADPGLAAVRGTRSALEYIFTSKASLVRHAIRSRPGVDRFTLLDADLFFFANPSLVLAEAGDPAIAIVPHRFPEPLAHLERRGRYNVGWLSFRRASGSACVERWRRQCLDWCHDREEPGRYAEQGYLDEWPLLFPDVAQVSHPGVNLAPWNLARHRVDLSGHEVHVDGRPLVFFHFHALRELQRWLYDPGLGQYGAHPTRFVRKHIYGPYLDAVVTAGARLARYGLRPPYLPARVTTADASMRGRFGATRWRSALRHANGILWGKYLLAPLR